MQANASVALAAEIGDTLRRIDGTEVELRTPWHRPEPDGDPAADRDPNLQPAGMPDDEPTPGPRPSEGVPANEAGVTEHEVATDEDVARPAETEPAQAAGGGETEEEAAVGRQAAIGREPTVGEDQARGRGTGGRGRHGSRRARGHRDPGRGPGRQRGHEPGRRPGGLRRPLAASRARSPKGASRAGQRPIAALSCPPDTAFRALGGPSCPSIRHPPATPSRWCSSR